MTSDKGAVNDSIDELLDGVPADPMLPKKRARSIEEVKAAQAAAPPSGRREDDRIPIREASAPAESSALDTFFLQAQANRTRWVVGVLVTLGVLVVYFFVRHARHADEVVAVPAPTGSASVMHVLSASAVPLAASDLPPPPATDTVAATPPLAPQPTAPSLAHGGSHGTKSSHSADVSAMKPPPPASAPAPTASNARSDVARSL